MGPQFYLLLRRTWDTVDDCNCISIFEMYEHLRRCWNESIYCAKHLFIYAMHACNTHTQTLNICIA